jgi:hypothetical protein
MTEILQQPERPVQLPLGTVDTFAPYVSERPPASMISNDIRGVIPPAGIEPNGSIDFGPIAKNAAADVGQQMWTHYGDNKDVQNGKYGCAASVSEVLQQSGYAYADSTTVQGLQQELQAKGWSTTTTPQPGDVVLGYRGTGPDSLGEGAHTGIVGPGQTVFNNKSGTWEQTPLGDFNSANFPGGVTYLHPPK